MLQSSQLYVLHSMESAFVISNANTHMSLQSGLENETTKHPLVKPDALFGFSHIPS